ncbi:MAG: CheB methylesterase domain-containing protein, partial [Deltaproteobacteria bacterium]
VILIGCSTGGPDALDKLFQNFPRPLDIPIIIVQHMPPVFTASLARRIQNLTGIPCAEGQQWEIVSPNRIYIAPGDFHMTLTQNDSQVRIRLDQGPKVQGVRPAVDNLFLSAVKIYGASCLGVVLTGMGEDGLQGAHAIKKAGGGLLIQSAESCVVFGMPGAIFKTGIHDKILDLAGIKRMIEAKTKKEGPAVNKVEAA